MNAGTWGRLAAGPIPVGLGLLAVPAKADPIADFYAKRQIVVTVGQAPGGGFDAYARLAGRHIGQQIPGNPTVVVQNRPGAGFQVVAVSPTKGTAASVQLAQSAARRHAEDVLRSMTDMGVPATRVNMASTTDPGATASEVRVFVR